MGALDLSTIRGSSGRRLAARPTRKAPENNQGVYEPRRVRLLVRERLYLFYSKTEVFEAAASRY